MPRQSAPQTPVEDRSLAIEHTGIEIIAESDRRARPRDLFWPWFAANISVFGISYGAWIFDFGLSLGQAMIVAILGIAFSFLLCGIIAIAGKRGSAPTMVLSRAAFGVTGQKVPGVVSWLLSMGWETVLAISATLATATVVQRLGFAGGTLTRIIACVVVAGLIVAASVAGYHIIMRLQSIFTWITGAMTLLYIFMTLQHIDLATVAAREPGTVAGMIGAFTMVATGFGLGWINIAADWSRYQSREASNRSIIFWNTFGGAISPTILVLYGLLLIGSRPDMYDALTGDPIGALAGLLPTWILVPFLITTVLSLVSGAVLGIYSSGLTLLSLGVRIPRPAAAAIDGGVLTLATIWVVFFAGSFIGPFQSFLITLGVPIASWAGIMIADILLRKRDYDEQALFDPKGRYGAWDWRSVGTMVVASFIGWGLVINSYAAEAPWNNWQGYLLGPLGGKDGTWAYANLGVMLALVLSFLTTVVLRRRTIARQEERL